MQFDGFVFGDIEVEVQGRAYDLHNFYRADAINYAVVDRTILLSFSRRTDDWVPPEEAKQIAITFYEVSYFSTDGRDQSPIGEDDGVIHSIGAVEPDAGTEAFYLTDNIPHDHHLVVSFKSGLTLRIQASEARCEIGF